MRPIGGELELQESGYKSYFTDSGRSSLRLFLRSHKNKKYLIPNYFCEIIETVFQEESVDYSFYNVFDDLTIDTKTINTSEYDVLYVINYFGQYSNLHDISLDSKILVEDNVFLYDFENHSNAKNWFAFNSFRKISSLSDGSIVKTTLSVDEKFITQERAKFSIVKSKAKSIKYDYIYNGKYSEKDYLDMLTEGENMLNNQKSIYKMSNDSLAKTFTCSIIDKQKNIKQRFETLNSLYADYCINKTPSFYSFFVMKIENRDDFRKKLMNENIFIPVHWPKSSQNNTLYDKAVSIPLFLNYRDEEFNYLIDKMKDIL